MKKWLSGIRLKLLLINMLSLVILLVVGVTGFNTVSTMSDKLSVAYNERARMTESLGEIDSGINGSFRWLWASYVIDNNLNEKKRINSLVRLEVIRIENAIEVYNGLPIVPAARKTFSEKFLPDWKKAKLIIERVLLELEKGDVGSNNIAREIMVNELRPTYAKVGTVVTDLRETVRKINIKIVKESFDYAEGAKRNTTLFVVLGAIVGVMLSLFMAENLARKLSSLSCDLRNSSDCVSSAAHQIAASSEQLSQASIEQASSLEQTSSSIHEMSSTVTKNSDNAMLVSKHSEASQNAAQKGKEVVQTMINSIADIARSNALIMDQVNQSNSEISEIVKVISEIGDKTKVINDIVFQTKLLSFNASVEAARAGENGKGFAVVAEEVGNLAQMSGKAAGEISSLLESSIVKVDSIVIQTKQKVERLISDGKIKIDNGTSVANECGVMLDDVVSSIASVTCMAREISESTKEQSEGVGEINRAISQINVATQQNSAGASQSAAAAEELSAQSNMLKNAVEVLVEAVDGKQRKAC